MYLLLKIKVLRGNSDSRTILMTLTNVIHGTVQKIFEQQSESPVSIKDQKTWAMEHIVKKLIELYPIRGKITEVGKEGIRLNIGENVGVELDQKFKVSDKDAILEISSVKENSSIAKVKSGGSAVSVNSKVEAFQGMDQDKQ